jgi:hypothetical protein
MPNLKPLQVNKMTLVVVPAGIAKRLTCNLAVLVIVCSFQHRSVSVVSGLLGNVDVRRSLLTDKIKSPGR